MATAVWQGQGQGQRVQARTVVLASSDGGLKQRLTRELTQMRWTVIACGGGAEAMAQVEQGRPEALLLDSWLPDLEVSEFAGQMAGMYAGMDVLRVDGRATGAKDAARSPRRNELLHAIREAEDGSPLEQAAVEPVLRTTERPAAAEWNGLAELVGQSECMRELTQMIRLVAPRRATVLILGETGTGKEVVAKALHRLSARAAKPFTVLNCAAIPEALLEAELFGHTRGAFTGAVQSRTGRIEAAHGGTLFLDEIGEMPLALQAKMLRFLECGELQRVGENETMRVDVRVLAATHQALEDRAEAGTFRMDLYHRLAVFPLEVPALRERMDDLGLLTEFFLERMGQEMPRKTLSADALAKLAEYGWPGNVRELMHVLERGTILCGERAQIEIGDVRLRLRSRC